MYSNIEAHVKWNSNYSDKFKINNGVKQGGVISPMLFTLYIDELISRILMAGVGCYIGKVCSAVFVYADDIILQVQQEDQCRLCLKYVSNLGMNLA